MASTVFPSTLQVKAFITPPQQLRTCMFTGSPSWRYCYNPSERRVIAQFGLPDKAKIQINLFKERLWRSLPDPVKEFPWKKAEDQVLQRLLSLAQEAFKCSFIVWFVLSFLSDILITTSKNQEVLLPFALFAGCCLSNFMKETSEELSQQLRVNGVNWTYVGITCVFVLLKILSALFSSRSQIIVAHVANGGLMQILWLWKKFQDESVQVQ